MTHCYNFNKLKQSYNYINTLFYSYNYYTYTITRQMATCMSKIYQKSFLYTLDSNNWQVIYKFCISLATKDTIKLINTDKFINLANNSKHYKRSITTN